MSGRAGIDRCREYWITAWMGERSGGLLGFDSGRGFESCRYRRLADRCNGPTFGWYCREFDRRTMRGRVTSSVTMRGTYAGSIVNCFLTR